jgi:ABC-2 type transport system permease protein
VSSVRLAGTRVAFEVRSLMRDRRAVVFSILLPVFLLVIFGSIFRGGYLEHTHVRFSQYFVSGLLASGLLYSSFQQLAIVLPEERANGTLKRLLGSPMPRWVYFAGKFGTSLYIYVLQAAMLLAIGHWLYHVDLPSGAGWATFAWVSVLGLVVATLLGVAFSSLAKDGRSASAMTTIVVLFFQFTSGVYFVYTQLPKWMQDVAAIFPLKWMAQAMRGVFLPASFGRLEAAGGYEFGRSALVLVAWAVAGVLLCRFTFRWLPKDQI